MSIFLRVVTLLQKWANIEYEYRRDVISLFEPNSDAKLLDVGCGDGEFTMRVAEKIGTRQIFGVDVVKESVDKAIIKGIKGYQADFDRVRLPFEGGLFDVVCANQIIEHLADTDTFVKEINRVLKPGGYAVISTPNLAAWHCILFLLLGWQPYHSGVSDECFWVGRPHSAREEMMGGEMPNHRRIFTLKALGEFLNYHGFAVQRSVSSGFSPLPTPISRLACLVDKSHAYVISVKALKA